jgi:hypothetical protein
MFKNDTKFCKNISHRSAAKTMLGLKRIVAGTISAGEIPAGREKNEIPLS